MCEAYFKSATRNKGGASKQARARLQRFQETATPQDLHTFVSSWNWDAGIDPIRQVIDNPRCDKGTALKVYWLAQPEYYLKYSSRDHVPEYEQDGFDLISHIERKYLGDEYSDAEIPYRPKRKKHQPESSRELPQEMYQPVGKQNWWLFWRR